MHIYYRGANKLPGPRGNHLEPDWHTRQAFIFFFTSYCLFYLCAKFRVAVILLNVLAFFDPLRELVKNGLREGFIQPYNERLIIFVDGPTDKQAHEEYDWGAAALQALDDWQAIGRQPLYDWKQRKRGGVAKSKLDSS
jgi:hypothetical protein